MVDVKCYQQYWPPCTPIIEVGTPQSNSSISYPTHLRSKMCKNHEYYLYPTSLGFIDIGGAECNKPTHAEILNCVGYYELRLVRHFLLVLNV